MPIEGQVYDLAVSATLGPWSDVTRKHPGLIVSQSLLSGRDSPIVIVPMTGTTPPVSRPTHVLLDVQAGSLDPPLWIQCEYPMTISARDLDGLRPRGVVPQKFMALVRNKLGWYLRTSLVAQ